MAWTPPRNDTNAQSAAGPRAIAENSKNGKIASLMVATLDFLLHIRNTKNNNFGVISSAIPYDKTIIHIKIRQRQDISPLRGRYAVRRVAPNAASCSLTQFSLSIPDGCVTQRLKSPLEPRLPPLPPGAGNGAHDAPRLVRRTKVAFFILQKQHATPLIRKL
jgi:hypothetical protein